MQHVSLGRTGLQVSRFVLGTMNFGPETTEADSHAIMNKALELGINFFDTADIYGWKIGEGVTEKILGTWFAGDAGRRNEVILATKCYNPMGERPTDRGLSAHHIRQACDASLKRMQTDHIDLYQMHHIERTTPWEEIWPAMERLHQQGKITYVGSSNFAGWDIAKANEAAKARHALGLVSEQSKYSLETRMIELEVIPACRDYGMGIIAWSPLSGGLLGGVLKKIAEGRRAAEGMKNTIEARRDQLQQWEDLCDSLGHAPANVALAWILSNPDLTGPIIGPRTVDQLTQSVEAFDITLDEDTLAKIDAIWPGPGGEAPKAYAW